ncbi:Os02g0615950 [Oryza sativa Japonica Group]|uniref:Os02g0615950 protein n=1 Tax=Oryza sativa subsp. japonica TaxID=39947 RepID=A0A0N7KFP2_ORYSJ|nr:Os02g0615950 [Oryza sativa Japonica Group]
MDPAGSSLERGDGSCDAARGTCGGSVVGHGFGRRHLGAWVAARVVRGGCSGHGPQIQPSAVVSGTGGGFGRGRWSSGRRRLIRWKAVI